MKTINVNGVTLAYKEYGSGEKYLISTQNFFFEDCHMALLGQEPYDYHVFLIYMRGYGESSHIYEDEPKNYTKVWGEDVIAFAEAMGINAFYYSGISHGNWAGWYISFHRPELLRGFICCDGITKFRPAGRAPEAKKPAMDLDAVVGNREALDKMAWIENWPTRNPERLARRAANHAEHLEILMNRKKEEFTVRNSQMSGCEVVTEEKFYDKIAKIPVPVMLINGGLDPLSTVEEVLKVAKLIPGCRMLTYQHLGHGGPDECPEMIARDCDRFFRDTAGYIL